MSLNGLDDPRIVDAHETTLQESRGWFLLEYSARDEVVLLSRGTQGLLELRNAVAEHGQSTPLYGFLKYRKRSIVLKYLPKDCSQLIQARVAVHFNAVCERFAPYDTTFDLVEAGELKEAALSAACSLHSSTRSTSSSSTSSIRRKRLKEITEEEGEPPTNPTLAARKQASSPPRSSVAEVSLRPCDQTMLPATATETENRDSCAAISIAVQVADADHAPRPQSPDRLSYAESAPSDLGYSSVAQSKPKVKLAPRTSLDVNYRLQTAGNFRPISYIPAGLKLFGSAAKRGKNGKDANATLFAHDSASITDTASISIIPEETLRIPSDATRPATSSGVVVVESSQLPLNTTTKKQTMTPEKARLMKAMRLREQKMMSLQAKPHTLPTQVPASSDCATSHAATSSTEPVDSVHHTLTLKQHDSDSKAASKALEPDSLPPPLHTDTHSDPTQPDSQLTSPAVASSETEPSTNASSLSEATDEILQAKDRDALSVVANLENGHRPPDSPLAIGGHFDRDQGSLEEPPSDTTARASPTDFPKVDAVSTNAVSPHFSEIEIATKDRDASSTLQHSKEREDFTALVTSAQATAAPNSMHSVQVPQERNSPTALEVSHNGLPLSPNAPHGARRENIDLATTNIPLNRSTTPLGTRPGAANVALSSASLGTRESDILPQSSSTDTNRAATSTDDSSVSLEDQQTTSDDPNTTVAVQERETKGGESSLRERRQARELVQPIQTNLQSASHRKQRSDFNLSDDEDLMEELQSATLQEAKPMLVAKTPVSATFPPSPFKGPVKGSAASGVPHVHIVRTFSNPAKTALPNSAEGNGSSTRSVSIGAGLAPKAAPQSQGGNLAKKSNIGSSISQRIKALEKISAASGDVGAPTTREKPSSTFFAVKRKDAARSPSVAERTVTLRKQTPEPPYNSTDSSPETEKRGNHKRSGSVTSRLSMFESPPRPSLPDHPASNASHGRPESVSVTANIVRGPEQGPGRGLEPPKNPSEFHHLDLKQSPLVVDHQKAVTGSSPADERPSSERRSRSREQQPDASTRQTSLGFVRDFIKEHRRSVNLAHGDVVPAPATSKQKSPSRSRSRSRSTQQTAALSRLSTSSRRSSISKDRDAVSSAAADNIPAEDARSATSDKKLSRAGRFMRRLSALSPHRNRTSPPGISSIVPEEKLSDPVTARPAHGRAASMLSDLGDVNVQFPDSLLWKRRNMCIDSQGFLVLSALQAQSGRQAPGTKRYHLSEFRAPFVPDVEVQELPNSVVLDFLEGTSIQIACEDRAGQKNVLNNSTIRARNDSVRMMPLIIS